MTGILLIFTIICSTIYGNVLGIDFGSNFISFGLLKAGSPITVVRNENEKRLTPALVTLDGSERFIGTRAVSKSSRIPKKTSNNIIQLMGRSATPPNLAYPYPTPAYHIDRSRGTLYFNSSSLHEKYSVELLASLIIQHVQRTTQKTQGVFIRDVAITVPPYFSQSQRQAILDAARVAQVNVLSLIDSNIAAAYQYGMERSRTMNTEEVGGSNSSADTNGSSASILYTRHSSIKNVVFVDMGGSQTSLSLIRFEYPITPEEKCMQEKQIRFVRRQNGETIETNDTNTTKEEEPKKKGRGSKKSKAKKEDEFVCDLNEELTELGPVNYLPITTPEADAASLSDPMSVSNLDSKMQIGQLDVLFTVTDESLGGRQVDSLIVDWLVRKLHREVAPEEVEQYGECKPFIARAEDELFAFEEDEEEGVGENTTHRTVTTSYTAASSLESPFGLKSWRPTKAGNTSQQSQQETNADGESVREEGGNKNGIGYEPVLNVTRSFFRTPLNPHLPPSLFATHTHNGTVCRRLLGMDTAGPRYRVGLLPALYRVAQQAKEMLSVASEYYGVVEDVTPSIPEWRFTLTRRQLEEEILPPVTDRLHQLTRLFRRRYLDLSATQPSLHLAEQSPLEHLFVQLMGGSMRIPCLEQTILRAFPTSSLQRLLNVDEAPALGSTMFAASRVERYNVKGLRLIPRAKRGISLRVRRLSDPNAFSRRRGNETERNMERVKALQEMEGEMKRLIEARLDREEEYDRTHNHCNNNTHTPSSTPAHPDTNSSTNSTHLPSPSSPLYEAIGMDRPDTIFLDSTANAIDLFAVGETLPSTKSIVIPYVSGCTLAFDNAPARRPVMAVLMNAGEDEEKGEGKEENGEGEEEDEGRTASLVDSRDESEFDDSFEDIYEDAPDAAKNIECNCTSHTLSSNTTQSPHAAALLRFHQMAPHALPLPRGVSPRLLTAHIPAAPADSYSYSFPLSQAVDGALRVTVTLRRDEVLKIEKAELWMAGLPRKKVEHVEEKDEEEVNETSTDTNTTDTNTTANSTNATQDTNETSSEQPEYITNTIPMRARDLGVSEMEEDEKEWREECDLYLRLAADAARRHRAARKAKKATHNQNTHTQGEKKGCGCGCACGCACGSCWRCPATQVEARSIIDPHYSILTHTDYSYTTTPVGPASSLISPTPAPSTLPHFYHSLTLPQIRKTQQQLDSFDRFEEAVEAIAELRNALEGFIFSTRELMASSADVLDTYCTPEQVSAVEAELGRLSEWMEDDGLLLTHPDAQIPESVVEWYRNETYIPPPEPTVQEEGEKKEETVSANATAPETQSIPGNNTTPEQQNNTSTHADGQGEEEEMQENTQTDPSQQLPTIQDILSLKLSRANETIHPLRQKLTEHAHFPAAVTLFKTTVQELKNRQDEALVKELLLTADADEVEDSIREAEKWLADAVKIHDEELASKVAELSVSAATVRTEAEELQTRVGDLFEVASKRARAAKYAREKKEKEEKKQKEREKREYEKKLKEERAKEKQAAESSTNSTAPNTTANSTNSTDPSQNKTEL